MVTDFGAFKAALIAAGYAPLIEAPFLQGYLAVQDMVSDASQVSVILLDGDPGTGKTFFAECLARVLGAQLLRHQMTPDAGKEELLYDLHLPRIIQGMAGRDLPETYREILSPGILVQAFQQSLHGVVVLLLDEMDKALREVDSYLLGCLQDRAIHDPHAGTQECNTGNLIVILTKNDLRPLQDSLMRRVRRIYTTFPGATQEVSLLLHNVPALPREAAKTLVTLANRVRAQKEKAFHLPSTPELVRCAKDLLVAPSECAGAVVVQWLIALPEDRKLLKESDAEIGGLFKYVRSAG